jgi:hypothetical protein
MLSSWPVTFADPRLPLFFDTGDFLYINPRDGQFKIVGLS